MKQGPVKAEIEAAIASRLGSVFQRGAKLPTFFVTSGVSEIDALTGGGLPRGGITEIFGAASSGRISLMASALACATANHETCALIDINDSFDPASAAAAQVDFDRLLWVRCGNSLERAFKATDLILQSGGFGLVALNLADVPARSARRIISSWWFRFRRAIESTPTVLMVITSVACVRSCAMTVLEIKKKDELWPSTGLITLNELEGRDADRLEPAPRLSLVSDAQPHKDQPALLTHSHLLRGTKVLVNREKPIFKNDRSDSFYSQVPLANR